MLELLRIFMNVLVPVFAVVAVGGFAAWRWDLDYRPLSNIGYRLLAPAFIFRLLSDPAGVDGPVFAMVIASFGTVVLVWLGFTLATYRTNREQRVLDSLAASFGNVGNLGFPIVLFALGEDALPAAGVHFLSITVGAFFLGIVTAARLRSGSAAEAVRRVVTTPAIAVTPFAVLAARTGGQLPLAITRFVDLLADAMIPVMLITLGMQLAHAAPAIRWGRVVGVAGAKLLGAPLVYLGLSALVSLGGEARDAGLLLAAMPTAVLVGLISLEYDLETEAATTVILAGSLASLLTLAIVLRLV